METHRRGDFTEAAAIAELKRRNIPVSLPFGDNERYDAVVEAPDGSLLRLQIKTGRLENGTVKFDAESSHTNSQRTIRKPYEGDIDYFLVYSHDIDELYLIAEEAVNSSMRLRVEKPKRPHPKINPAERYAFDKNWPLNEHATGSKTRTGKRPYKDEFVVNQAVDELGDSGIPIFKPEGDSASYDFLAETPEGAFARLTVRTATVSDGRVGLNTGRENPRTARATDYYLLYCHDRDAVYLIPADEFDKSIELWVEEPKQVQHNTKFATDYELEDVWPPSDAFRVPSKSAVGAAIQAFERLAVPVGHVSDDSLSYDLLVETPDETFARVAVVPGWISRGCIRLKPDSCDGIDHFVIYHREANTCYVVAADAFNRSISLRVEEPEKRDQSINWAEEHELEENWPPE